MPDDDQPDDVSDQVSTTASSRQGTSKNELAENYLPGEDEWHAKTIFDLEDPARYAVLKQMGEIYPEVEELQPVIDGFLEEYLPAKTSINGTSREEAVQILKAMHGVNSEEDNTGAKLIAAKAVGAADDTD